MRLVRIAHHLGPLAGQGSAEDRVAQRGLSGAGPKSSEARPIATAPAWPRARRAAARSWPRGSRPRRYRRILVGRPGFAGIVSTSRHQVLNGGVTDLARPNRSAGSLLVARTGEDRAGLESAAELILVLAGDPGGHDVVGMADANDGRSASRSLTSNAAGPAPRRT